MSSSNATAVITATPICDCAAPTTTLLNNTTTEPLVLKILTLDWKAKDVEELMVPRFEAYKNGNVKVEVTSVTGFDVLFSEIENDSRLGLEVFDAYVTPPVVMGSVVQYDGFADMTNYITENYLDEWLDIFPGYRDIIATYNGEILMMPFDGDVFTLYYNREVLENFNLSPPRTWDEYNDIAEKVHGQEYNNKTLIGNCIGRTPQCAGPYWAVQVLSSMTQTQGSFEGGLFDTKDMTPLTGEALMETLRIFEKQHKFGHPDEFDGCIFDINQESMKEEECVLTYNWGNSFLLDVIRGKLGIAKVPGSTKVLDRETGKLVKCDKERCPHAIFYDDIGFVNHVPYAAFGGWSGAVSGNVDESRQKLAMEFLTYTASKEQSRLLVIPEVNSSETASGFDPYRKSHIDVDAFVEQGYDRETTTEYLASLGESLLSPNLATDIRFPKAAEIHSILDTHIINHLNTTSDVEMNDELRREVVNSVDKEWAKTIDDYNKKGDTTESVLEQYQRLRGVYVSENENQNLIGNVRWVGYSLGIVVILLSLGFGVWVWVNRKHRVVKVSQPIFLLLICFGVIVLASAIFPLGVDDSIATQEGANAACVSIPWLVSCGFSLVFAALFSKLWRINRVFTAAASMKRVVVTERDVLKPFAVLMTLNFIILLSWTLVDPPIFERVYTDELTSYGRCSSEGNGWKGFLSALALLNFGALILANVQAYMARSINDELSESKYIGLSTLSMFQIFIVGVPLLVIVYQDPSAYFFMWTGIIFIVTSSILLLIFIPKLITWKQPAPKKSGNKWSSYGSANSAGPTKGVISSHQSSVVSEVEKPDKTIPEKDPNSVSFSGSKGSESQKNKRVSFSDKQSDAIYREKLDDIKDLVLEEHKIDISPIIAKLLNDSCEEVKATSLMAGNIKDETIDVETAVVGEETA